MRYVRRICILMQHNWRYSPTVAIHSEKSRKQHSYFDAPLKSTVQSIRRAFERSKTFLGNGQGSFYLSNWNLIPAREVNF